MDLGEMVKVISQAKRNLFPVVDVNGELLGIVVLDDIRNIMFRQIIPSFQGGKIYDFSSGTDQCY